MCSGIVWKVDNFFLQRRTLVEVDVKYEHVSESQISEIGNWKS